MVLLVSYGFPMVLLGFHRALIVSPRWFIGLGARFRMVFLWFCKVFVWFESSPIVGLSTLGLVFVRFCKVFVWF